MTTVRIVGLIVCAACVAMGIAIVRAGNRMGYLSIIGGAFGCVVWTVALIVAASR